MCPPRARTGSLSSPGSTVADAPGAAAPAPAPSSGAGAKGSGSAFTKKLGPLPVWAWMGIGLAGALILSSLRKGGSSQNSTAQQQQIAAQEAAQESQLASQAAQTPPYVTQNYASSTVGASSTQLASGSVMSGSFPSMPQQGTGAVQRHINAVNAWTEAGGNSGSSPQANHPIHSQPHSAGAAVAQAQGPGGGGGNGGGGQAWTPPSQTPNAPRRPSSSTGGGQQGKRGTPTPSKSSGHSSRGKH